MKPLATLVALCLIPGIGGVTLRTLLNRFGTLEAICAAPLPELQSVSGIGPRTAAAIHQLNIDQFAAQLRRWQADGTNVLTWSHRRYPARLARLRDAPPILFYRGTLSTQDAHAVAVVGTRQPTPTSRHLAEQIGAELAQRGWTVVSGLAWGVDMAAHTGAAQKGRTLAVLGNGVQQIPPKKQALARRIINKGALLSEVRPDAAPNPATLVARNRLISGMSQAVIVVEAGEQSGSMYTARFAQKQGRPLFVVDNASAGNRMLLAEGAQPIPPFPADLDGDALSERLACTE